MASTALTGKVAVIGGGAKNLGGLISRTFGADGAAVVIHYNSDATRPAAEETMQAVKAAGGGMPLAPSWGGSSSPTPPAGHVTENARGRATLISRNGRAFKSGPALAQEIDRTVKAKTAVARTAGSSRASMSAPATPAAPPTTTVRRH